MKAINPGHFLLTCRLDNWVHLLEDNHFHIARDRLPQALYISATALALAPAAAAESLIYRKRIRETKIEKDPIFILGHWRSGTTYLQNVLSRDEQFGWFDPVNTIGLPYSLLLGRLIQPPIEKGIRNGAVLARSPDGGDVRRADDLAVFDHPHDRVPRKL